VVGSPLFIGIALWRLAAGVAIFTFVIFFGQLPGVAAAGVSIVKIGGFVLVASWLLRLASRSGSLPLLVRDHPALASGLAAFFAWAVLSALWAADGGTALSTAFRLGQGILLVFVVFSALRERRDLRAVLWAYVGG